MAEALRKTDIPDDTARRARVVPMPSDHGAAMPDLDRGAVRREVSGKAVTTTSRSAEIFKRARLYAVNSCSTFANTSRRLTSRTSQQLHNAREEHPLQVLAVITGIAFAAGIAFRIWRSKSL